MGYALTRLNLVGPIGRETLKVRTGNLGHMQSTSGLAQSE